MSLTLDRWNRLARLDTALPRLWTFLVLRLRRHVRATALRSELDRMDAHILQDLGISRAQLRFEVDEWEHGRR